MSPEPTVAVPRRLRDAYRDWDWTVAWQFVPDTMTYRLENDAGTEVRYLKIAERSWTPSPRAEAERMRWARSYLPVPEPLASGTDGHVSWLITAALPGRDATDPDLLAQPERLVPLLGSALARFHQIPVAECPFDFRLDTAQHHVRRRAAAGLIDPERDFHPEHEHLTVDESIRQLERTRPATEDLVVCHGDYCLPNVLIQNDEITGFVDLGELGVADRWWDLAVATWSVTWNLGPGWEDTFLSAYGVEGDLDRLAYYRLLYDLVS